jgi:hypothetical protein
VLSNAKKERKRAEGVLEAELEYINNSGLFLKADARADRDIQWPVGGGDSCR